MIVKNLNWLVYNMSLKNIVNDFDFPEISNEKVIEMFKKIKPVIRNKFDILMYIEDVDPIERSFTWDPKHTLEADNLELITDKECFMLSESYPGLWKPSMKEVFSFLQDNFYIDEIAAVEINFLAHHDSGDGNIGRVKIFRKVEQ